jgi:hypothetical protein
MGIDPRTLPQRVQDFIRAVDGAAPKRSKYGNTKVLRDGHTIDSKREDRVKDRLDLEQKTSDRKMFYLRQVPFHLPGGVKYVADFLVFREDYESIGWIVSVLDAKGVETREFKTKRKLVEALFPVKIETE